MMRQQLQPKQLEDGFHEQYSISRYIKSAVLFTPEHIAPIIYRITSIGNDVVILNPMIVLYGLDLLNEHGEPRELKVPVDAFLGARRFLQVGMLAIGAWALDLGSYQQSGIPIETDYHVPLMLGSGYAFKPHAMRERVTGGWDKIKLHKNYNNRFSFNHFFLLYTGTSIPLWYQSQLGQIPKEHLHIKPMPGHRAFMVSFKYYSEGHIVYVPPKERPQFSRPVAWKYLQDNPQSAEKPVPIDSNIVGREYDPFHETFKPHAMDEFLARLHPVALPLVDPERVTPGFTQIGYTVFEVDPSQISFNVQYPTDSSPLLRAGASQKNPRPRSEVAWSMQVTISEDDVQTVLVPLLRQIDRCPFLPITNSTFFQMGIQAVAVHNIQVEVIPNAPNALVLTLGGYKFNYTEGSIDPPGPMELLFNWPLFKLYTDYMPRFHHVPTPFTGSLQFEVPSISYIERRMGDIARRLQLSDMTALEVKEPDAFRVQVDAQEIMNAAKHGQTLVRPLEHGRLYYVWKAVDVETFLDSLRAALPRQGSTTVEGTAVYVRPISLGTIPSQNLSGEEVEALFREFQKRVAEINREMKEKVQLESFQSIQSIMNRFVFVSPTSDASPDNLPVYAIRSLLDIQSSAGILNRAPQEPDELKPEDYVRVDFAGVVWERLAVSFQNHITTLPRETGGFVQQFLGRTDTVAVLEGVATEDGVLELRRFMDAFRRISYIFRGYGILRDITLAVRVKNEVLEMMGMSSVLPIGMDIQSVPGFPKQYRVSLQLVSMDPSQSQREQVRRLSSDVLQMWELSEGLKYTPIAQGIRSTQPEGLAAFSNFLEHQLAGVETYPDLRLPTFKQVNRWIELLSSGAILEEPTTMDNETLRVWISLTDVYPASALPIVVKEFRKIVSDGAILPNTDQYCDPDFFFCTLGMTGRKAECEMMLGTADGSVDLGRAFEQEMDVRAEDSSGLTYRLGPGVMKLESEDLFTPPGTTTVPPATGESVQPGTGVPSSPFEDAPVTSAPDAQPQPAMPPDLQGDFAPPSFRDDLSVKTPGVPPEVSEEAVRKVDDILRGYSSAASAVQDFFSKVRPEARRQEIATELRPWESANDLIVSRAVTEMQRMAAAARGDLDERVDLTEHLIPSFYVRSTKEYSGDKWARAHQTADYVEREIVRASTTGDNYILTEVPWEMDKPDRSLGNILLDADLIKRYNQNDERGPAITMIEPGRIMVPMILGTLYIENRSLDVGAVSHKGALGLCQAMPYTWRAIMFPVIEANWAPQRMLVSMSSPEYENSRIRWHFNTASGHWHAAIFFIGMHILDSVRRDHGLNRLVKERYRLIEEGRWPDDPLIRLYNRAIFVNFYITYWWSANSPGSRMTSEYTMALVRGGEQAARLVLEKIRRSSAGVHKHILLAEKAWVFAQGEKAPRYIRWTKPQSTPGNEAVWEITRALTRLGIPPEATVAYGYATHHLSMAYAMLRSEGVTKDQARNLLHAFHKASSIGKNLTDEQISQKVDSIVKIGQQYLNRANRQMLVSGKKDIRGALIDSLNLYAQSTIGTATPPLTPGAQWGAIRSSLEALSATSHTPVPQSITDSGGDTQSTGKPGDGKQPPEDRGTQWFGIPRLSPLPVMSISLSQAWSWLAPSAAALWPELAGTQAQASQPDMAAAQRVDPSAQQARTQQQEAAVGIPAISSSGAEPGVPTRMSLEHKIASSPSPSDSPMAGRDIGGTGWHDFIRYGTHGRLIGCFPTYCVLLVLGGRWIRFWRLWDQFYGLHALASIDVYKSRFTPTHRAQVVVSNMFNNLLDATLARVVEDAVARGYQSLEYHPDEEMIGAGSSLEQWWHNIHQSLLPHIGDYERQIYEIELKSLMVKPGMRLHIRMGYGSCASNLPVIFNGTIEEVQVAQSTLLLNAVGDGAELERPIRPTSFIDGEPHYIFSGLGGIPVEPRQIIVDIMTTMKRDALPILGPLIYGVTGGGYLNANSLGIHNFGLIGRNKYAWGWSSPNPGETCINVYNSTPLAETYSNGMYGILDLFILILPFGSFISDLRPGRLMDNEDGKYSFIDVIQPGVKISIDVNRGTIWDVIANACRMAVLDYVASVEPFDLRSTLFFGRRDYPFYYTYMSRDELIHEGLKWTSGFGNFSIDHLNKIMRFKQFTQYYYFSYWDNLLSCDIQVSSEKIVTDCATADTSGFVGNTISFDPFVLPEDRREIVNDSWINTTSLTLLLPGSPNVGWINWLSRMKLFRALLRTDTWGLAMPVREVNNVSANVIRESMQDMYAGQIQIAGTASIKPHDFVFIHTTTMSGPVGVKEVIHHLSVERGFVTSVTPDLVALGLSDKTHFQMHRFCQQAAYFVAAKQVRRYLLNAISFDYWAHKGGMMYTFLGGKARIAGQDLTDDGIVTMSRRSENYYQEMLDMESRLDDLLSRDRGGVPLRDAIHGELRDIRLAIAQARTDIQTEAISEVRNEIRAIVDAIQKREIDGEFIGKLPEFGSLNRWLNEIDRHLSEIGNDLNKIQTLRTELDELINKIKELDTTDASVIEDLAKQLKEKTSQFDEAVAKAAARVDNLEESIDQSLGSIPKLFYRLRRITTWRVWRNVFGSEINDIVQAIKLLDPNNPEEMAKARQMADAMQSKLSKRIQPSGSVEPRYRGRLLHAIANISVAMVSSLKDTLKNLFTKAVSSFIQWETQGQVSWSNTGGSILRALRQGVFHYRPMFRGFGSILRSLWFLGKFIVHGVSRLHPLRFLLFIGVEHFLELMNRKINTYYPCGLYPVRVGTKPLLAGLRGHSGTVYGDDPSWFQRFLHGMTLYGMAENLGGGPGASWFGKAVGGFFSLVFSIFINRTDSPILENFNGPLDAVELSYFEPDLKMNFEHLKVLSPDGPTEVRGTANASNVEMTEWELNNIRNNEQELVRELHRTRSGLLFYPSRPPDGTAPVDHRPESVSEALATLDQSAAQQFDRFLREVQAELRRRGLSQYGVFIHSARRSLIHQRALYASRFNTIESLNAQARSDGIPEFTIQEFRAYRRVYPRPNPYPVAARSKHQMGKAIDVGFFDMNGQVVSINPQLNSVLDHVASKLRLRRVPNDPPHVEVP